jgi:hypothetical protein
MTAMLSPSGDSVTSALLGRAPNATAASNFAGSCANEDALIDSNDITVMIEPRTGGTLGQAFDFWK